MAVVYICIAIGAGMFLVWIIIDYLNAATALKPKADICLLYTSDAADE